MVLLRVNEVNLTTVDDFLVYLMIPDCEAAGNVVLW